MHLGATETRSWGELKRIAEAIRLRIQLGAIELRDRWRDLWPRLVHAHSQTSSAIERELVAIRGALRRIHTDISTPDP